MRRGIPRVLAAEEPCENGLRDVRRVPTRGPEAAGKDLELAEEVPVVDGRERGALRGKKLLVGPPPHGQAR